MTRLFARIRQIAHGFVFVFTLVVLGVSANFASIFLPNIQQDFTIYSIVITSGTIIVLLLLTSYSQPRTELFFLILLAIGWVTEAAWATDIIGYVQCDMVSSTQKTVTANGEISSKSYCYQMKTIEAFSWANFALFTLFTIILISLATRAHALNRPFIWAEPIAELPWFGQYPGMEDDAGGDEEGGEGTESRRTSRYGWPQYGGYPAMGMPPGAFWPAQQVMPGGQPVMAGGQPAMMGPQGYLIQQQPGHSVVIQQGQNGQPPVVSQVPTSMNGMR